MQTTIFCINVRSLYHHLMQYNNPKLLEIYHLSVPLFVSVGKGPFPTDKITLKDRSPAHRSRTIILRSPLSDAKYLPVCTCLLVQRTAFRASCSRLSLPRFRCSTDFFDPSTELSRYRNKSWITYVFKFRHVHVIAPYADGNVAGENSRVGWHNLRWISFPVTEKNDH